MRVKYKVGMITILLILVTLIIVEVGYINYQKEEEITTAMIQVKSGLSINYLNGTKVSTDEDTYAMQFSVTNTSDEPLYYYIKLNNILANEDVTYKLVSENKQNSQIEAITKTSIVNRKVISGNTTQSYELIFYNPSKKLLEGELAIDLEVVDYSLKSVVLGHNQISNSLDGLALQETEEGPLYYFKGNTSNNYVSFANQMWRIVKLNPDGTVKLVLDSFLPDPSAFYETNEFSGTSFLESNVYQKLNYWYEENLLSYDDAIANAKYCTDDNAMDEENGTIYFLPETRLFQNHSPSFTCPGTTSTSKIGLLTADEVMAAGASEEENKTYYLYNEQVNATWWTMTPIKKEAGVFKYVAVLANGALTKDNAENILFSIRPTITLIKKLKTEGNGTIDSPYTVSIL